MLDFFEINDLKIYLSEHHAQTIHLHDTCGGQYFTMDQADEYTEGLIKDYLSKMGQQVIFEEDKLSFTIPSDKKI